MDNNETKNCINWLLIESIKEIEPYIKKWNALLQISDASLFSSPQWLLNWANIYWQNSWQLKIIIGLKNNQLIAIAPLYLQKSNSRFSLSTLMPIGQGEPEESEVLSEYQDIIIAPNNANLHAQLAEQIKKIKWDQIHWNAVLNNSNWLRILPFFKYSTHKKVGQRYLLNKTNNYLSALSKNNRSKWNKCKNKLVTLNAKFIWVPTNEFEPYWQSMISFHQNRWKNKGEKGAFFSESFTSFHKHFQKHNITKLSALIVNDKPIAINYYLQDNHTLYFYQSGWDANNHTTLSPGFSLHIWSIINNPLPNYDFMMGDINDSYKNTFNCSSIDTMFKTEINFNILKVNFCKIVNKFIKTK